MPENLYEGMFLLDSGKFASNPDDVASQVVGILEKAGGTVVAHRPWQDGRLAYSIEGRRKALHFLTYFRMPSDSLTALTRACKLSDLVLRYMVIKPPPKLFDAMVSALQGDEKTTDSVEQDKTKEATVPSQSNDKPD